MIISNLSKRVTAGMGFFAMGFISLSGIVTNYVGQDFHLPDRIANLLPSAVYLWFLMFSLPAGSLMNKIGRLNTVIYSLMCMGVALLLPLIFYSFCGMLLSFSLLGISNTFLQVALNPIAASLVSRQKVAGFLTLGQSIKAIASFLGPILTSFASLCLGDWKMIFPMFFGWTLLTLLFFFRFPRNTEVSRTQQTDKEGYIQLLKDKMILFFLIGIICHVGLDVGAHLTAPRLLMETKDIALEKAGYLTGFYFLCRLLGNFWGSFVLVNQRIQRIFFICIIMIILAIGLLFLPFSSSVVTGICLLGFFNANVYSILISQAFRHNPKNENEISGLMSMGVVGGTLFPLLMGAMSDAFASQKGASAVLLAGALYLLFLACVLHRKKE